MYEKTSPTDVFWIWPNESLNEDAITITSNCLICKLSSNSSALSSYAWKKKTNQNETPGLTKEIAHSVATFFSIAK